jgi:GntR family transcriptional regulator
VGGEMSYNFNDETPIYLQIIEHIKTQIISEKYMPKQKLPSVRELSFEFEVNPNTVQKALSELENMGLIFTERTNGKFVTDNEALIADIKKQTMQKMIDDFYMSMEKIGIDRERVLQILIDERSKK